MALIPCPDCAAEVSPLAPTCPSCGRPIATADDSVAGKPVITTQSTSKRFKGQMVIGALAMVVGVIGVLGRANAPDLESEDGNQKTVMWAATFLIGGVIYAQARFRAWWHHR